MVVFGSPVAWPFWLAAVNFSWLSHAAFQPLLIQ
jgi:hypothetical protein